LHSSLGLGVVDDGGLGSFHGYRCRREGEVCWLVVEKGETATRDRVVEGLNMYTVEAPCARAAVIVIALDPGINIAHVLKNKFLPPEDKDRRP
jgi:hypothetical protein